MIYGIKLYIWTHRESNPNYTLRRGMSYPLNDGFLHIYQKSQITYFIKKNFIWPSRIYNFSYLMRLLYHNIYYSNYNIIYHPILFIIQIFCLSFSFSNNFLRDIIWSFFICRKFHTIACSTLSNWSQHCCISKHFC